MIRRGVVVHICKEQHEFTAIYTGFRCISGEGCFLDVSGDQALSSSNGLSHKQGESVCWLAAQIYLAMLPWPLHMLC